MAAHLVDDRSRSLYIAKSSDTKPGVNSVSVGDVWYDETTPKIYIYTGSDNDGWVDITALSGAWALLALSGRA